MANSLRAPAKVKAHGAFLAKAAESVVWLGGGRRALRLCEVEGVGIRAPGAGERRVVPRDAGRAEERRSGVATRKAFT